MTSFARTTGDLNSCLLLNLAMPTDLTSFSAAPVAVLNLHVYHTARLFLIK
jgi:hypothetical protein